MLMRSEVRQVIVSGKTYSAEEFRGNRNPDFADTSKFHTELADFLREWFNDSDSLTVLTSGSTGKPQAMTAKKERMWASAAMTCSALDLHCGQSALLCLPLNYIAGKMLVVRALFAALELYPVTPCANPLAALNSRSACHCAPDFAALTPMQVYSALETPQGEEQLKQISRVIIGGGAVDERLFRRIQPLPNAIYSSYGMTETLSHIALCLLSRAAAPKADASAKAAAKKACYPWYRAFAGVKLSLSEQNTLVIDAPAVAETAVATRDLAEIAPDGSFRILGRVDNVINSGGLKVRIEELEEVLSQTLHVPFAISSAPDERLGEIIVLLLEGRGEQLIKTTQKAVQQLVKDEKIQAVHAPRRIALTEAVPLTETGKPARGKIKELVRIMLGNVG